MMAKVSSVAREYLGGFPDANGQVAAHLGTTLKTPTRGNLHQFDAATGPFVLQLLQQLLDGVGPDRPVEKQLQVSHGKGLSRTNESRLEDALGIQGVHVVQVRKRRLGNPQLGSKSERREGGWIAGRPVRNNGTVVQPSGQKDWALL